MIKYLSAVLILFISNIVYLKVARKFNILDRPDYRGSSRNSNITGGGVVFYISFLLFFAYENQNQYSLFFVAVTTMAFISFIDDIQGLSVWKRLLFQSFSIVLLVMNIGITKYLMPFCISGVYIINSYNFMDGINGITGIYSLVLISAFCFLNYCYPFMENNDLMIFTGISLLIFSFYNFRDKAVFFAGDVGSIVIGMIVFFLLLKSLIVLKFPLLISFILIYMIDTSLTILRRLTLKENIFEPHRKHLYQVLFDNTKLSHYHITIYYSFIQFCFVVIAFFNFDKSKTTQISILLIEVFCLIFFYLMQYNKLTVNKK